MESMNVDALDVGRVWEAAVKVLGRIGLAVPDEAIRARLARTLPREGDRVLVPAEVAEQAAQEIREKFGADPQPTPPAKLSLVNSPFTFTWLDGADGKIKPQTVESVTRHAKLLGQLTDEGEIFGVGGGVPSDVPGELRFIMAQYLRCLYMRRPWDWGLISSEAMMRTFREFADVMGYARSISTEIVSPLRFTGDSVHLAIAHWRDFANVGVDPMPIMGVTAPLDWHAAWAQTVAENVGCFAFFRALGIENITTPGFRLFVPNWTAAATYFSSPQHAAALLARRKIRRFFRLEGSWAETMLVTSKAPDAQAAMEKTLGALMARNLGIGGVEGAGTLWLDEIFSPQQLLIDIEIKNYVDGAGASFEPPPAADLFDLVNAGLASSSFLAVEDTLDRYGQFLWKATLSDLRPRAAWEGDGSTLLKKAAAIADEKAAAYTYELSGDKRTALDAALARAKKEFGG